MAPINHRKYTMGVNPGLFDKPWIGDAPSKGARRNYMFAYFKWLSNCSGDELKILEKRARCETAESFHEVGWVEVPGSLFSHKVAENMWYMFFERYRVEVEWPWADVQEDEYEGPSKVYDDLRKKLDRGEALRPASPTLDDLVDVAFEKARALKLEDAPACEEKANSKPQSFAKVAAGGHDMDISSKPEPKPEPKQEAKPGAQILKAKPEVKQVAKPDSKAGAPLDAQAKSFQPRAASKAPQVQPEPKAQPPTKAGPRNTKPVAKNRPPQAPPTRDVAKAWRNQPGVYVDAQAQKVKDMLALARTRAPQAEDKGKAAERTPLVHRSGHIVDGFLFPEQPRAPSLKVRELLWKRLQRDERWDTGPFEIKIPAQVDFEYLLFGTGGHNFAKLQAQVSAPLMLAWRYVDWEPKGATPYSLPVPKAPMAKVPRALVLGLKEGANVDTLVSYQNVLATWPVLKDWAATMQSPQAEPLIDYILSRFGLVLSFGRLTLPDPSSDTRDAPTIMAERARCEVQVQEILAKEKDVAVRRPALLLWALEGRQQSGLYLLERLQLAVSVWIRDGGSEHAADINSFVEWAKAHLRENAIY